MMQQPSPVLNQNQNQKQLPLHQSKKKHRSSNNKVAKFFRGLFSHPAAATSASASAGTTPIGAGSASQLPPPRPSKQQKNPQQHQQHGGVWQSQRFYSGESAAAAPTPSWLIEVSLPFGQQQAQQAAPSPTAPPPQLTPQQPQQPQQRSCLRTLEQLQRATWLKSQFLTPPSNSACSCPQQRQVATSHCSYSSPSQPESTPIPPSAAKPSSSGFSNATSRTSKVIAEVPVRQRTSLREIATDRAVLDKCRKCPAVVKVTSSYLRVAPTPRTLWLHIETLKPLSPMPASVTASQSLTPLPSLPPAKFAGSASTTALTTLPTPPPPQLAKQRPPATTVQAPLLPPLLISPPSSPAVSCCSSSTSLPPQLLRSSGAESPPPTASVVGRVAEAVRRLNSAAASPLQRIPQRREAPREKLLASAVAAAAAAASTGNDTRARTLKPSKLLSRAATTLAPRSTAPQTQPSFSELLSRFEDFDRRRRGRVAAAAAVAAEAAASVSAVVAVAAASATSSVSPTLPTTKTVTSETAKQENGDEVQEAQKEPANVDSIDHHLMTSPMIEEAVDTADAFCAASGGRAGMRVIRLLALSLVTAVLGNVVMRLALAYKDDLYNS